MARGQIGQWVSWSRTNFSYEERTSFILEDAQHLMPRKEEFSEQEVKLLFEVEVSVYKCISFVRDKYIVKGFKRLTPTV